MKKATIMLLFILFFVSAVLLSWQWKMYSNEQDLSLEMEKIQQHFTVEAKGNELYITHNITGLLNDKEYQITKPDSLYKWECKDVDGNDCQSNDDSPDTFLASNGELNFHYQIPIPNQSTFLLTEWISSIAHVEVVQTTIDIVEKERRDSTWVAGIPQIGFEELSLIDFYTFKGKVSMPALYWQQAPITKKDVNSFVSFFSNQSGVDESVLQNIKHLKFKDYTSIILTKAYNRGSGNGIWIVSSEEQLKEVEGQLVYAFFENKFRSLASEEKWILELLTAEVLERPALGQKSTVVLQELSSKLSETERQSWSNKILLEDNLNFQKLDEFLGSVKGLKTAFFTLNRNEHDPLNPLYFVDPRNVVINEITKKNIQVIYRGKEILFPFIITMSELGFLVKSTDGAEVELSKEKNRYKFYMKQPFFHYNEEKFGLLGQPFVVENEVIYIKHQALQSIFNVVVEEDENRIKLKISK
jgi:hypothetical protein